MKLQLALDVLKTKEALKIASRTAPFIDIIEAGTPLIKQESLNVVKLLKKRFPKKKILADMKTMDTGALEARLSLNSGANITTVCLAAAKETILGAMNEGEVMLDTIGLDKKEIIARLRLLKVAPPYICLHRAIDQKLSKSIENFLTCIKDVKKTTKNKTKIAVAGSINEEIAKHIAKLGKKQKPDIVIVGAAITKAKNPGMVAKRIKEILK